MKRVDKTQQIEELLQESKDAVGLVPTDIPTDSVLLNGQIVTPFGPSIWVGKVSPELVDATLQCVEEVKDDKRNDLSGYLAGRIDKQKSIEDILPQQFKDELLMHTATYVNHSGKRPETDGKLNLTMQDVFIEDLKMVGLWVNLQTHYEFNPIHSHSGDFSFVYYPKNTVSYEDATNNKWDMGQRGVGGTELAGSLQLLYGEVGTMNDTVFSHYPQEGDLIIFPSWLKHAVNPFYCEGERVSVSGNIFYIPTNNEGE
jgi:hypothetical protein